VDNFVAEALAGCAPRRGTCESEDAGAEAFEAKCGSKGGDLFVHEGGELLEE